MQTIRELMNTNLVSLERGSTVLDAARCMKEHDIGDVLVMDGGRLLGILTDRDIVVRCLAEQCDPQSTDLGSICTGDLATLSPDDSLSEAVRLMEDKAVRRIPVVEDGRPVGIVSIGDLAIERDERSALAEISSAPPNH
jgi:CBS domain-containing protein